MIPTVYRSFLYWSNQ